MTKILVIGNETRVQSKVKGSRFIASAAPVQDMTGMSEFLTKIKQEFHNATHNVYAWYLEDEDPKEYYNDDGEPAGSSGPPVLGAIKGLGLSNVVVVVSRYFGGTKLGIPGLIAAYGEVAKEALQAAPIMEMCLMKEIGFAVPYEFIGNVSNWISSMGFQLVDMEYKNISVEINLLLPVKIAGKLLAQLKIITKGNMNNLVQGKEDFYPC